MTREWWAERASRFELLVSELVHQEAAAGHPEAAQARLAAIAGVRVLKASDDAAELAQRLVEDGPIPAEQINDALHIANAAVNGIDYLLTWNCKHLANAVHRARVATIVEESGYACPIICTPEELMED
jgi:predicted nucleic acid-binding protein